MVQSNATKRARRKRAVAIPRGVSVVFMDEFDRLRAGRVSRVVPRGEYSATLESLAIDAGEFGFYCRRLDEVAFLIRRI